MAAPRPVLTPDLAKADADIRAKLARALCKQGLELSMKAKPKKAIQRYEEALRVNPNSAEAHANLANELAKLGKREAYDHYEAALSIDPKSKETHFNFGNMLVEMRRRDQAMDHYRKAIEIDPNFAAAREALEKVSAQHKE
jgi:tetratricopeptide (TPR) repeat protein